MKKLCDAHDCCMALADESKPSFLNISSYLHFVCSIVKKVPKIRKNLVFFKRFLKQCSFGPYDINTEKGCWDLEICHVLADFIAFKQ